MAWYERDYYSDRGGGFGSPFGGEGRGLSVTAWLLIANCVIFVLDSIMAGGARTGGTAWLSVLGNFNVAEGIYGLQIWRFVTYQFLHAGIFHILINMLILYFFGPLMEGWWGSRRFLVFYLLCGVSGAVLMSLIYFISPAILMMQVNTPLVGASGSIFGLLIGGAVLFPKQQVMLLIPPIPMTLRTLALVLLGVAVLSVLAGTRNAGGEAAHLGGAALGYLLVKHADWLDWADRGRVAVPTGRVKQKLKQAQQAQKQRQQEEVDRILDKVKQKGIQSLTRSEKKTLNRATEREREKRAG